MLPEQRIATDYADHLRSQPSWNAYQIQGVIDHLTPTFEQTKPEKVFAGIVRNNTFDYMHIMVFSAVENLDNNNTIYLAADEWQTPKRRDHNFSLDINVFSLSHMLPHSDNPDWDKLIVAAGTRGTRYTQIYPPLPGDSEVNSVPEEKS